MRMTQSLLDKFQIRHKTHDINTDTDKDDFTLMEKFLALLEPIKKIADLPTYSTIHMVFPTIKDFKTHIDGFKKDKVIRDTAKYLSKEFDDYFR